MITDEQLMPGSYIWLVVEDEICSPYKEIWTVDMWHTVAGEREVYLSRYGDPYNTARYPFDTLKEIAEPVKGGIL